MPGVPGQAASSPIQTCRPALRAENATLNQPGPRTDFPLQATVPEATIEPQTHPGKLANDMYPPSPPYNVHNRPNSSEVNDKFKEPTIPTGRTPC